MYKNEIVLLENLKYKKSYAISVSHFERLHFESFGNFQCSIL